MGNPSTCTQAIKQTNGFLNEFLKATHPTTHQRLRQSTLAVLLIEEGIKPKEEEWLPLCATVVNTHIYALFISTYIYKINKMTSLNY